LVQGEKPSWLYTAITRAENEIHIVGSAEDLRVITEARSSSQLRNSYLVEMLKSIRNFKGFPHD